MKCEVGLFDQVAKPVTEVSCQRAVVGAAFKLPLAKIFLRNLLLSTLNLQ